MKQPLQLKACFLLISVVLLLTIPVPGMTGDKLAASVQEKKQESRSRIPLAVLGDSDSHAYQDRIFFPPGTSARGGEYRSITWQWTEVLARLRNDHVDLGPWGVHGTRQRLAGMMDFAGLPARTPRKEDHENNFAVSGAYCEDLNGGRWKQTLHLARLIRQQPERWNNGIVVIRIGINSVGAKSDLDRLALNPSDPVVEKKIHACTEAISQAVDLLKQENANVRFVLVGIFNNAHWAKYLDHWRDPVQLQHIDQGLDLFDDALRTMARSRSDSIFLDDRGLFQALWGGRDANGAPDYRSLRVGRSLTLTNTAGDAPHHMVVGDGHIGTIWNGLWTNHLLYQMQQGFGLTVPPITNDELLGLVVR